MRDSRTPQSQKRIAHLKIAVIVVTLLVGGYLYLRSYGEDSYVWEEAAEELGLHFARELHDWTIDGELHGFHVHIDTPPRRRLRLRGRILPRHDTRYRVSAGVAWDLGLDLTRHGQFSTDDDVDEITVGDPTFDAEFVVRGADATAIRSYLTPGRRARLLMVFDSYGSCRMTGTSFDCLQRGRESDPAKLVGGTREMVALVQEWIAARLAEARPAT